MTVNLSARDQHRRGKTHQQRDPDNIFIRERMQNVVGETATARAREREISRTYPPSRNSNVTHPLRRFERQHPLRGLFYLACLPYHREELFISISLAFHADARR